MADGERDRPRRRRKSTAALHSELLSAAGYVFATRGYGGASTREIADRANTTVASIYRHYGSKSGMFVAAVAGPFEDFVAEYEVLFAQQMRRGVDPGYAAKAMVTALYDQLHERQQPVFALIAASREPEAQEAVRQAVARLDELFGTLHRLGVELWEADVPFRVERAELFQRLVTGMLVSATVLESIFMPADERLPGREEMIEVITDLVTKGFLDPPAT